MNARGKFREVVNKKIKKGKFQTLWDVTLYLTNIRPGSSESTSTERSETPDDLGIPYELVKELNMV